MEGHFHTEVGAGMTLVGQPNVEQLRIDNPIHIPLMLSFLTHQRWDTEIKGLTEFPRERWPDNIPLLYYAYHIMAGLGSLFIGLMALSSFLLYRGKLFFARGALWALMLAFPLPFVANTAGWMTSELGRQPWLVHGLLRTSEGSSENVSSGSTLFSLLGFMGLYAMLSLLFFLLVTRQLERGLEARSAA
jgi:cytochrome d ubiquinol oxidase subunit I